MVWKIGLIGFGNVGQGLIRILHNKKKILKERFGFEFEVVGIVDPIKGSAYKENGLDLGNVIKNIDKKGNIHDLPENENIDALWLIKKSNVDIIVEVTPTNIKTGEPGLTHIKESLKNKKHVVTSNKGPIALRYTDLKKLADEKNVILRFEGTVLSGTPAINLALESLAGCDISRIQGIVNGTTNFILSKMEEGKSYNEALKEAQMLGYAEADPTADVDGWDAAVKAVILANIVMNGKISINDLYIKGIRDITVDDIRKARSRGKRIKLIAEVSKNENKIEAKVSPIEISLTHPLANVMGAVNALSFTTDHLGEVTIIGPGAGRVETGQALITDILSIHRIIGGK